MKRILTLYGALLLGSLLGCSAPSPPIATNTAAVPPTITPYTPKNTTATEQSRPPNEESPQNGIAAPYIGYTQQRADGNHFVSGRGQLPNMAPIDIPLSHKPVWVVAVPWDNGSLWVVVLEDGQVQGFQVDAQGWQSVLFRPTTLEPGQPPLLVGTAGSPSLLITPSILASPLTHAIPLYQRGLSQAHIDTNGNLIVVDDNLRQLAQIELHALPDARILQDENERLLLLTGPTEKYDHGVLGDTAEAKSITLLDDPATGEISAIIRPPENLVIEGIAPIWADLNGDGTREIVVTVSNAQQGAQILVLNEEGQQIAAGPAIGQGYRWRHQIAVAPFGLNDELELVAVRTPHLGGVVEFYRWEGDRLKIVAQLPGYTSHIIGTRNLDMAAAGDFDGDGQVELLLPNQNLSELGAIRRADTDPGTEVAWSLPVNGQMVTNLGAVTLPDEDITIGIGQENGILLPASYSLRIWHP